MCYRSFLLGLVRIPPAFQSHAQSGTQFFGVEPNPAAEDLLHTVEKEYGKPIDAIVDSEMTDDAGGSTVSEDGTPTIKLNPISGINEMVIVHELMHLHWLDRKSTRLNSSHT